jgi:hypothetical protein
MKANDSPLSNWDYRCALEKAEKRHDKVCDKLEARRKLFQATCPHKNVEYVPDASGNNDSYHECNDCGKIL